MEIHGNLDLRNNLLRQVRLEAETNYPVAPQPGRLLFREADRSLYICATVDNDLPVWVPFAQIKSMFRYTQNEAALEWTINHGLNINPPMVQIYDGSGEWVIPDRIISTNPNTCTVVFNTPTAGQAVILRGAVEGQQGKDVAFEADFTGSAIWVVNHGLGYNPDIKVYVDGYMVQPTSIVHNSTMQATVTFVTAESGYVRCY